MSDTLLGQIKQIQDIFDAEILYSPAFPPGSLERIQAMAERKSRTQKPALAPVPPTDGPDDDNPFADEVFDMPPPDDDVSIEKRTMLDKIAALLSMRALWRFFNPPITFYMERHYQMPEGMAGKDCVTIRVDTMDEYFSMRAQWDDEWAQVGLNAIPPNAVAPAAQPAYQPPPPPPPHQQQFQPPPPPPPAEGWCSLHGIQMELKTARDGSGRTWWSHYLGTDPSTNKPQYCSGGRRQR